LAAWPSALCFDAPVIALAWQGLYAEIAAAPVAPRHCLLVFAAVWLGYAADRWLDARRHCRNLTLRHRFFARWRRPILVAWLAVFGASAAYALSALSSSEVARGLPVAMAGAGFVFTAPVLGGAAKLYIKSLATALLVLASAALFTVSGRGGLGLETALALLSPGALFLCNCLIIHGWDAPIDRLQEGRSLPPPPRVSRVLLTGAGFQALLLLRLQWADSAYAVVPALALLSLTLIAAVAAGLRGRPALRRLAADAALLTPLLVLVAR